MSQIAKYHDTNLNNILKLNPNIKNPDKIQPGQQVVIDEIKFKALFGFQVAKLPANKGGQR